jgi:hypothetical protein
MNPSRIESSFHGGDGFQPLVIRSGWQVSQLNDRADLHADALSQVERHDATAEVFLLVKGAATLAVGSEGSSGELAFTCVAMEPGVTYTVPGGVWHAIATTPGMQVMIVEKDNTHVNDVILRDLTEREKERLRAQCREEMVCVR